MSPGTYGRVFSDILCAGAEQAVFVNGIPELPVKNLAFKDCVFTADKGVECHNSENTSFENVLVNGVKL